MRSCCYYALKSAHGQQKAVLPRVLLLHEKRNASYKKTGKPCLTGFALV